MRVSQHFRENLRKVIDHSYNGSANAAAGAWSLPQRTIAAVLKGERVPSIDTAEEIAVRSGFQLWQMLQDGFNPSNPPMMMPVSPEQKLWFSKIDELRLRALGKLPANEH